MSVDFGPAIDAMLRSGDVTFGPREFRAYVEEHELGNPITAEAISVDSLKKLAPSLKAADTMVFRLGRHGGARASFGLARASSGDVREFFLDDAECLAATSPEVIVPPIPRLAMLPFRLLPKLTETSLVNLACGAGVLHHALGLDAHELPTPATGQSVFSFVFRPTAESDAWEHRQGQVEIDALFAANRGGSDTMFLVEAKAGPPRGDLAKHKLVYPYAALRSELPKGMEIVPVYLKTWEEGHDVHFLIVECELSNTDVPVVNSLRPKNIHYRVLAGLRGVGVMHA